MLSMRARRIPASAEMAQALALTALTYLLADSGRAARFCAATGFGGDELRSHLGDLAFLGGVLDFVLEDEALLAEVAAVAELPPETVTAARRHLPGAPPDD